MKLNNRILTIAFLIVGIAVLPVIAQEKGPQYGVATSVYDKAKNETTIEVKRIEVVTTKTQLVFVNAAVVFPGEKLKSRPEDVMFIVQFAGKGGYKYSDIMKAKVKPDEGKAREFPILNLDKRAADGGFFLETLGTRISYDIFKSIARAKTVELTIGETTVNLTSTHLAPLAEMDKMINP